MAPDDHSFCKLLPGFVISAGTQVLLKVAKPLPVDGDRRAISEFLVARRLGQP